MPNYGNPEYWEARYKDINSTFDWLEDYKTLKDIIDNLSIPKETGKIINLGCGNSEFSENMYDDGYLNIYNIDISKNVINIMKKRNEKREKMIFEVMDVRDLKLENNSIDLAIDKSTIDALLCGENSFINVAKMIKEVQRVLKVGGYYMIISYGSPENRVVHLERKFEDFDVQIYSIENNYIDDDCYEKTHYIYLCKKLKGADDASNLFFEETLKELERQEKNEEEMMKNNNYSNVKNV